MTDLYICICLSCIDGMMVMYCVLLQGGSSALHYAAINGHVEAVDVMMLKNPELIKQTDKVSEQMSYCILIFEHMLYSIS